MTTVETIIIGGGIAGLSCASHLKRLGKRCLVLESAETAGGHVVTLDRNGYRLEVGPNTFMGSAGDVLELIQMNGLDTQLVSTAPRARRRFIVREAHLHEAPLGARAFLRTRLLSVRGKLRLATEPWRLTRGAPTDSAEQFFCRRFGREAAEILAGAFISGVYAGDMRQLSAPAAFPLFWRFEAESGSMIRGALRHKWAQRRAGLVPRRGLFTLRGGLGALPAAIADGLGDQLLTRAPVFTLGRRADLWHVTTPRGEFAAPCLVLSVPPPAAADLLAPVDAQLAAQLASIELAPVAVVYLCYQDDGDGQLPEGFGFLAARGQQVRSLGVLFSSSLFEDRAPRGHRLISAFVGGVTDPDALALSDTQLFALVRDDLARLGHCPHSLTLLTVMRHCHAIPQFNLDYLPRMAGVRSCLAAHPGLLLAGNYLTGVGMKDAVSSGKNAASAVVRFHAGSQAGSCLST